MKLEPYSISTHYVVHLSCEIFIYENKSLYLLKCVNVVHAVCKFPKVLTVNAKFISQYRRPLNCSVIFSPFLFFFLLISYTIVHYHTYISTTWIPYLSTLKPKKYEQMGGKSLKIGTFLNFLYCTTCTDRFLQKWTHGQITPFFTLFLGSK